MWAALVPNFSGSWFSRSNLCYFHCKSGHQKAGTTNQKYSPASPTTTAMVTRWVMLKNLGTAREVSFPLSGYPPLCAEVIESNGTTDQPQFFNFGSINRFRVSHSDWSRSRPVIRSSVGRAGDALKPW
jgi:hypothetical protein